MNDITFIITWYGQANHLIHQLNFFKEQGALLNIKPKLILINDGHKDKEFFARMVSGYRRYIDIVGISMSKDIGFNSHMCRNVGVQHAKTDWIMLTDIDCYLSNELFCYIISEAKLDDSMFYMPKVDLEVKEDLSTYEILDPKGIVKLQTHPNTWIMTRECFWSTGGYDIEYQSVRQGDAEFFISIGRPGVKEWDYDLIHPNYTLFVKSPIREDHYIRQDGQKSRMATELVDFVRVRNTDPYRKYRKRIKNMEWDYV